MSEYLWDKTGEPDAEVERLEALLSSFRHAPRALELPAEAAPAAARRTRRFGAWRGLIPARLFGPAWLAAAAALLLALLFGAGTLLLRTRVKVYEERAATHEGRAPSREEPSAAGEARPTPPAQSSQGRGSSGRQESQLSPREAVNAGRAQESAGLRAKENGGALAGPDVMRRRAGVQPVALVRPRQRSGASVTGAGGREGETPTLEAMAARGSAGAASLFDSTRLMAKEQLIYALRLTGAKFKEVQTRAHGADEPKAAARGGVR